MGARFGIFTALIALAFTGAFVVAETGRSGTLRWRFLQKRVAPTLLRVSGLTTDLKFRFRGPRPVSNKIVLVAIDDASLKTLGRWPWPRVQTALLMQEIMKYQPIALGMDMFFSEDEERIPESLAYELQRRKLGDLIPRTADSEFVSTVKAFSKNLVMAWTSDTGCYPRFPDADGCPVTKPESLETLPKEFAKFSIGSQSLAPGFSPAQTAVWSAPSIISNIPEIDAVARHTGFVNSIPDPDGTMRVVPLVAFVGGNLYPSLPFEMARTGLKDTISAKVNAKGDLEQVGFMKGGEVLANRRGFVEVNFRGPAGSFTSISAIDLLSQKPTLEDELNRKLAGMSKADILTGAYVLLGVTALGMHDYRPTPFDGNVPGLEVQATVLDNLLSRDFLTQGHDRVGFWAVLLIMSLGMFGVTMAAKRQEAWPALLSVGAVVLAMIYFDFGLLFSNNHDWNTGFLYLEAMTLMGFTLVAKYLDEEKKKKFIRGAFAKYLAPAVVDQIVQDPTSLHLGGTRKPLTILFSDIRGFTTFSERMDAKLLSEFLNDYLGIMTGLVFENRGTLDKYIGDAVMAFWGAPIGNDNHALDCCQTAVKMLRALDEHRPRFKQQYGVDVYIGAGINTGEVSVGNMGSEASFSYTVIGDSVNLASRLEGATKAYGIAILATQFTLDAIRGAGGELPPHRILDSVKVKGKKKAVEIVEILYRDVPREALDLFQEGRALYTKQDWDAAVRCFERADRIVQEKFGEPDGPSRTYLARCEKFKAHSPGPDWDGSWEFDSK